RRGEPCLGTLGLPQRSDQIALDGVDERIRERRRAVAELRDRRSVDDEHERPLARRRRHGRRTVVEQADVAEGMTGPGEPHPDPPPSAFEHLLDGAVQGHVGDIGAVALPEQDRAGGSETVTAAPRRSGSWSGANAWKNGRRRRYRSSGAGAGARFGAAGGRPSSSVASARDAASASRRSRSRPHTIAVRRRLIANAVGSSRERRASRSARPKKSAETGSSARTVAARTPPSTSASSPTVCPARSTASSASRPPGSRAKTPTEPEPITNRPSASWPWRKRVSSAANARRWKICPSSPSCASGIPAKSGTASRSELKIGDVGGERVAVERRREDRV